jgi:hypothetical protein
MITGMHAVLYSSDPEADRDFFKNVLRLTHVDAGRGWLIFGLPPSEIAVHPAENNGGSEIFFLCDSIDLFVQQMKDAGVPCEALQQQRWGRVTYLTLPGGGRLGVYEPSHARPA